MNLTGKAKLNFSKWYFITQNIEKLSPVQFRDMEFNLQYGVFVDWFDSVGIYIDLQPVFVDDFKMKFNINILIPKTEYVYHNLDTENRDYSRVKAIKKANKYYNKTIQKRSK